MLLVVTVNHDHDDRRGVVLLSAGRCEAAGNSGGGGVALRSVHRLWPWWCAAGTGIGCEAGANAGGVAGA